MDGTEGSDYTRRLTTQSGRRWKRLLDVQAPYRWNLRRQHLGRTLDVGCGIGRNLVALDTGSVGVDHNPSSVAVARSRGLSALTVDDWQRRSDSFRHAFDSLLLAHVIEHLPRQEARDLLLDYLPALRPAGRVMFICPQERGYRSDPTHVEWTTGEDLQALAEDVGLRPRRWKSFPFPRTTGRLFRYNEFTLIADKPAAGDEGA